eukprot:2121238-Lingulodinium_polyedra.AAC.1
MLPQAQCDDASSESICWGPAVDVGVARRWLGHFCVVASGVDPTRVAEVHAARRGLRSSLNTKAGFLLRVLFAGLGAAGAVHVARVWRRGEEAYCDIIEDVCLHQAGVTGVELPESLSTVLCCATRATVAPDREVGDPAVIAAAINGFRVEAAVQEAANGNLWLLQDFRRRRR